MANLSKQKTDGSIIFGIVILGIGLLLLVRKLGFFIPDWVLSWPMILIVIGTFTLIKHEFKSAFGGILLGVGLYFLFEREFDFNFGIQRYIFPIVLIILGIYLITQKRKENQVLEELQNRINSPKPGGSGSSSSSDPLAGATSKPISGMSSTSGISFNDKLNIDAIFSGVNKRVLSKNFQGGKLTSVFGGIDLDLTQADFSGVVVMQVDVIFGGLKMVVPPHWDVRTEVSNIAAGVEDKRIYRESEVDSDKVLLIKGTILFGGLEIKSF